MRSWRSVRISAACCVAACCVAALLCGCIAVWLHAVWLHAVWLHAVWLHAEWLHAVWLHAVWLHAAACCVLHVPMLHYNSRTRTTGDCDYSINESLNVFLFPLPLKCAIFFFCVVCGFVTPLYQVPIISSFFPVIFRTRSSHSGGIALGPSLTPPPTPTPPPPPFSEKNSYRVTGKLNGRGRETPPPHTSLSLLPTLRPPPKNGGGGQWAGKNNVDGIKLTVQTRSNQLYSG